MRIMQNFLQLFIGIHTDIFTKNRHKTRKTTPYEVVLFFSSRVGLSLGEVSNEK